MCLRIRMAVRRLITPMAVAGFHDLTRLGFSHLSHLARLWGRLWLVVWQWASHASKSGLGSLMLTLARV